MTKYIRELVIVALVLWVAWSNIFNSHEPTIVTETVVEYDTVEVEVEAEPEIKWYPKVVADNKKVDELNALVDSLQNEMNEQIEKTGMVGEYVAEVDTTIKDVGTVSVVVKSRIPLDPDLRFILRASLVNKIITNTTTITNVKTFWQRFGISAQTGIGMGLITKQVDIYVGVGFHFDIN